jgi:hypothetical protein
VSDLKRSLGIGYFESEYSSNNAADLSWDAYVSYVQQRDDGRSDAQLLSERERLVLAEKVREPSRHSDHSGYTGDMLCMSRYKLRSLRFQELS